MGDFNIWQIVAGIGIFLIGIQMLENALKNMMSRSFKLFLRRQTSNTFKAIFGGTIVTAILQSSSAVNFMVLAFVSTGVITMRNAFAVIMGTNLGTTLDSWIVATIGFKFDIEAFAYPIVGIAGILIFIYEDRTRLKNICSFLIGFSFLFIGLGFMKESVENEYMKTLFADFAQSSNFIFLIIGFVATTITQSSSATIALTLSILSQQLINFESAIAVVIGSEVGTSVKLILGSLDGVAVKKRVAAGNFIYNMVLTVLAFIFLKPIAVFITGYLSVDDPLVGLVTFQTGINLFGIILFLPLLDPYSKFLDRLFKETDAHVSAYIHKTKPEVADAAIGMLEKETIYFMYRSERLNLNAFGIDDLQLKSDKDFSELPASKKYEKKTFKEQYSLLKEHHGEIQSFYIQLGKQELSEQQTVAVNTLMAAVRSCMHASKCIKDIHDNLLDFQNSSEDVLFQFYNHLKEETYALYKQFDTLNSLMDENEIFNTLSALLKQIQKDYNTNLHEIYAIEAAHTVSDMELATLINVNRELFTSHKAMLMALKNLLLSSVLAEKFSEMPTYQS
ncbi:MAG: Na/Pi cotransporter family protein [Fimbriimonadaceae bacterium]|nr:Na/Pi cotransporter family protein [Chitinophagales bacterium]